MFNKDARIKLSALSTSVELQRIKVDNGGDPDETKSVIKDAKEIEKYLRGNL